MGKYSYGKKNKKFNNLFLVSISLICSLLFITVGFSALSTSLSIDGSTSFVPVGLIRVMSMRQDNLDNATEYNASIMPDSIKNTLDLNSADGQATYIVVIKNLGQIDYVLDNIEEMVYSNDQIEYILDGFQIGNVIHAKEEITFKITFKYKDGLTEPLESRINSTLKFAFEEYVDTTSFKVVFSHEGICNFNGTDNISGYDCTEYANKNYINTGISLYDEYNWEKDYEIGFTIEEYNPSIQINQAVFINAKYENANAKYPGLVFRRDAASNDLELTQTINGTKLSKKISNYSLPLKVKILRIDGVIYYTLNDGELIRLQEMNNFNQQFDVSTWFGAAPDINGNPIRALKGSLSNMYIKLGKYTPKQYTITFNPNGGNVTEQTRTISEYTKIGTLPIPTNTNNTSFIAWYSDAGFNNKISEDTVFNKDTTLYAKWSESGIIEMNGAYYDKISDAIASAPDNIETTIKIFKDIGDKITIPKDKNIVFDFGANTLSNNTNSFTIENNGILKILSGKFVCNSTTAVINNNSTGTLIITGGEILATGTKQAIYNDGGTLTISGDAYLSATSNIRATVHNLNNGMLNITGGTIISSNQVAVNNESGIMIIGSDEGTINATSPLIQGKTYGINSSVDYSIYDGIIKGMTNSINNNDKIANIANNAEIINDTEVIGDNTFKTLYLGTIS